MFNHSARVAPYNSLRKAIRHAQYANQQNPELYPQVEILQNGTPIGFVTANNYIPMVAEVVKVEKILTKDQKRKLQKSKKIDKYAFKRKRTSGSKHKVTPVAKIIGELKQKEVKTRNLIKEMKKDSGFTPNLPRFIKLVDQLIQNRNDLKNYTRKGKKQLAKQNGLRKAA